MNIKGLRIGRGNHERVCQFWEEEEEEEVEVVEMKFTHTQSTTALLFYFSVCVCHSNGYELQQPELHYGLPA